MARELTPDVLQQVASVAQAIDERERHMQDKFAEVVHAHFETERRLRIGTIIDDLSPAAVEAALRDGQAAVLAGRGGVKP